MPRRFAILKHDHPFLHWDLLLEEETTARAWRLLRTPCPNEPIAAEPLSAHRLFYLDYEGPVSGDRGHVTRAFAGEYMVESSMNDVIRLQLSGIEFASSAMIQTLSDGRVFVTFIGERGIQIP